MKWTHLKSCLDLFLYSTCPLCGRSAARDFCQGCQQQIQRCQLPNSSQFWQGQPPVFPWGLYEGTLKRAITALKYDNQPQLANSLSQWLAQAWLNSELSSTAKLTVIPIPLHQTKQEQRGYNQAALLARGFCSFTGLPLQCEGLKRARRTQAQFGLSTSEREQNLVEAFCLGSDFLQNRPSHPILLLDDIYTTGATARAATQTLEKSGKRVYGLVAVATTRIELTQQPITQPLLRKHPV